MTRSFRDFCQTCIPFQDLKLARDNCIVLLQNYVIKKGVQIFETVQGGGPLCPPQNDEFIVFSYLIFI